MQKRDLDSSYKRFVLRVIEGEKHNHFENSTANRAKLPGHLGHYSNYVAACRGGSRYIY